MMHCLLKFRALLAAALMLCTALGAAAQDVAVVMIGHASVPRLDAATAQRLYTGRAVEASGVGITPVNLAAGHPLRERFMAQVLAQDNDKYVAYWTVRKHIGKGTPPREFKTTAEVIEFVQSTPGAIGYVDAGELKPAMNVVLRAGSVN
jgi:ABC-type phosphate transport system substrate-binding protein